MISLLVYIGAAIIAANLALMILPVSVVPPAYADRFVRGLLLSTVIGDVLVIVGAFA